MTEIVKENFFGNILKMLKSPAMWVFMICISAALYVNTNIAPTWTLEKITLDVQQDENGLFFSQKGAKKYLTNTVLSYQQAQLTPANIQEWNDHQTNPPVNSELVFQTINENGVKKTIYYQINIKKHWKLWSLLPALVAIFLCWITREPVAALSAGIICGAFILGRFDLVDDVLLESMLSRDAAGVLVLYLWLLGGLMGIWSKTGATQVFGEFMTKHFVRGPKSAKFVGWLCGFFFFQGGSISCILTGTTVRPIADREKISHEEMSYIVDANSTSIATVLAFNAWPSYIQSFAFVAGVPFLATEALRVSFYFQSIPFFFYSFLAILFTFLISIEKMPFLKYFNPKLYQAQKRSAETGELDAPGAEPLSSKELQISTVPAGYKPIPFEFFMPLIVLIGTSVFTFIVSGVPKVRWGFGLAIVAAMVSAMLRGMKIKDLMEGLLGGFKGVILGALILLLAVTIGEISKELGGGSYLIDLLGGKIPAWLLPVALAFLTMFIAFSTGTSWGTFAVTFPLALPLAWFVASTNHVAHPFLYMSICFATVINGSIFGDQCSPISDTCILSAMTTGCDLMDHTITQIFQSIVTMLIALTAWTLLTIFVAI